MWARDAAEDSRSLFIGVELSWKDAGRLKTSAVWCDWVAKLGKGNNL